MSRSLDDLHPVMREKCFELLARCVEARIHVLIVDTLRSKKEQAENVAKKVSWTMRSKHCLSPKTLVLTPDFLWVPLSSVKKGGTLLGFDEQLRNKNGDRHYCKTTVLENSEAEMEVYEIKTETGSVLEATSEHLWLADSGFGFHWVPTKSLRKGPQLHSFLVKVFDIFSQDLSFDGGWISGMFDGEGCLIQSKNAGTRIVVSQRPGHTLEKLKKLLVNKGVCFTETFTKTGVGKKDCVSLVLNGRLADKVRFLGVFQPKRLIQKYLPERDTLRAVSKEKVVQVRKIGKRPVMVTETSSKTFIAEGFATHNCVGKAIDIVPLLSYMGPGTTKANWDDVNPQWGEIGRIGEALGLKWGVWKKSDAKVASWRRRGELVNIDLGHFELKEE